MTPGNRTCFSPVAVSLALFGAPLLPAQTDREDARAVYAAAIEAIFHRDVDVGRPRMVEVQRSTPRVPLGYVKRWEGVPAEMLDTLSASFNTPSVMDTADLPLGVEIRPDSARGGISLSLSRIAFAQDSNQALVYVAVHCGHLCGGGDVFWLRRMMHHTWLVKQAITL